MKTKRNFLTLLALSCASFATADEPAAPLQLEHFVVNADRLALPENQSAARVDVLTPSLLSPFAVKDVGDALNLVPNLTVQRYGSVNGEAGLSLYGFSGSRGSPTNTLIALDGVPLNSGLIAQTSLNMLPSLLLEHIEVVQGPASSAYGSNAMNGVVNLKTRRPVRTENALEAAYGTWQTSRVSAYAGSGKANDYRLLIGLQQARTDGHLTPAGTTDFSDAQARNVALIGEKTLGRTTVSAAWAYYDWDRHSPSATLPGAAVSTQFEKGSRQHLHLGLEQKLTEGLALTLAQLRNESTERGAPALGSGSTFNQRVVNDGTLAQLIWGTGANLLGVGAEYQEARLTDRVSGLKYRGRTHGLFVQDRLLLLRNQLSLTAGLRYDDTSTYTKTDTSPKLGLSFQPEGSDWRLRANYGEAFASPTFTQTFSTRPPLGNTALVAQSFELLEVGADWQIHRTLLLGATVYRGTLDNPIYPRAQATPPYLLQYVNVSPGTQRDGFYVTALWQPTPGWRVDASYTYLAPGASTFHTARHSGKVGVAYQSKRFTVGLAGRRESHRFWQDNSVDPVAPYTVVDLRAGYALSSRAELFASAENLFDETYATGSYQAGRVNNRAVWIGIPRPGRYLDAGFKLKF